MSFLSTQNGSTSSGGDVGIATPSSDGLMSKEDKTKLDGVATSANNYVHPTTAGNKHIPSGGSVGKVLKWSADGAATWEDDRDHTYEVVSKTAMGLTPQLPNETTTTKYLRQDGTWVVPPNTNTTYVAATETVLGLSKKMPTQDDSVATDIDGLVIEFNSLLAKLKSSGLMS